MNAPTRWRFPSRCAPISRRKAFIEVDKSAFRAALAKTPFYKDWREKFGDKGWGLLEAAVGQLA
jgi:hypothetical protein